MSATLEQTRPANLLIVDDTPANLQLLAGVLKQWGHKVRPVPSGRLALQAAQKDPPDLILLDISMPEMNGYEVCERLKADERLKAIPVIFISALSETMDKVRAFSVGGVDYVTKPFQVEEVQARVDTHLKLRRLQVELEMHTRHLEDLVQTQVKEISDSQMSTIFALAKLSESRDEDTGRHLERVQEFCRLLAAKLAMGTKHRATVGRLYVDNIYHAAPMHDVGKVAVPDGILLKPGRLTPDEFELMKQHTVTGAHTLGLVRERYPGNAFIAMGIAIARSHHEKWDGAGYPDGLAGERIPLSARIMALADVYDALRSRRPYKPPFSHEEACETILGRSLGHFDPDLLSAFRELQEEYGEVWEKTQG